MLKKNDAVLFAEYFICILCHKMVYLIVQMNLNPKCANFQQPDIVTSVILTHKDLCICTRLE